MSLHPLGRKPLSRGPKGGTKTPDATKKARNRRRNVIAKQSRKGNR